MDDTRLVISQKKLKLLLGGLGIALPTILYLGNLWIYGNSQLLESMSGYYYSPMRDLFVGILFAIGVFLVAYEGYGPGDRLLSTFGGILMIMVALFPTTEPGTEQEIVNSIHLLSAALAYVILMIFCLFLFTKTNPKIPMTGRKKIRNGIYYLCGLVILGSLTLLILSETGMIDIPFDNSTFWFEYAANSAFGTAWLVKGEGIFFLNDDPILEMHPWEIFGFLVLVILALGSGIMLVDIFVIY